METENRVGVFLFFLSYIKMNLKNEMNMKSNEQNSETKSPMLWYWSQPETGRSVEDCEMIAKENMLEGKRERRRNLYIAFV